MFMANELANLRKQKFDSISYNQFLPLAVNCTFDSGPCISLKIATFYKLNRQSASTKDLLLSIIFKKGLLNPS
jgi:hypothetical protein